MKKSSVVKRVWDQIIEWYESHAEGLYLIIMILVIFAAIMVTVSGVWYPLQTLIIWTVILIVLMLLLLPLMGMMEIGCVYGILVNLIAGVLLVIGWVWFLVSGGHDGFGASLWSHIVQFLLGSPRK